MCYINYILNGKTIINIIFTTKLDLNLILINQSNIIVNFYQ